MAPDARNKAKYTIQPSPRHRPLARGDACSACRARKVRCPGQRPACTNCRKHNRDCQYSDARYALSMTSLELEQLPPVTITPASHTSTDSSLSLPSFSTPISQVSLQLGDPSSMLANPSHMNPDVATDWNLFPFTAFLPIQGITGSPDSWGQTLPPEYAGLDIEQLLRDVAQGELEAAAEPSAEFLPEEPTAAELEHLLWMYFSHQRLFCLEMHIGTFWARQQSSDPNERPHPCLLNAIYLVTCWASPSAAIKSRALQFYEAAKAAFDQSVRDADRPIDAVRAGTLLACWLYGTARFGEGAMMVATTAAAAISCGLNNLSSARWKPDSGKPSHSLLRQSYCHSYVPSSQIDLADRIYAFWAIFLCERCSTVSQSYPENFNIDRVSTPLPRRWSEYENPGDHLDNHETLFDLMMGKPPQPDCTDFTNTLKAIEMVTRASHLKVDIGGAVVRSTDAVPPRYPNAVWSGGERTRQEKQRVEQALQVFMEHLPPRLQTSNLPNEKSISNTAASMQYLIGAAQIFLYDTNLVGDDNAEALAVVRRLLGVMHLLGDRNDWGDVGLFVVMIWGTMGRLLIREALRLESLGDTLAAALLDAEIRFVKEVLRSRGRHIRLAELQFEELDFFWQEGRVIGGIQPKPAG